MRAQAPERAEALQKGLVDIGQASAASGVSAKMIRHYEEIGLLPVVPRTAANYRLYAPQHVQTLRFIHRARALGFSMDEIRALLGLWQNRRRPSAAVRKIAQAHIEDLQQRIAQMQGMVDTLGHLVHCCHGDERPDCPILVDLAGED
ncbi:Cu(I)-responsive transcriptional regulator [Viridibacterium curvum]|uniref:Cu(I)-responsive transcriptional regulator n=1 Tax=Viridibacterium curvum TaxID=1101404 RepID=A0ABP9QQK4_9RHOO